MNNILKNLCKFLIVLGLSIILIFELFWTVNITDFHGTPPALGITTEQFRNGVGMLAAILGLVLLNIVLGLSTKNTILTFALDVIFSVKPPFLD